jgi:hypothetical protein
MQRSCRDHALHGRWRHVAPLLALLALLANQALLPTLHFAAAASWTGQVGDTGVSHHHARSERGNDADPGAGHQVCHFCRFGAVALPPPSGIVAVVLFAPQEPVWIAADEAARPRESYRTEGLARAPPLIA